MQLHFESLGNGPPLLVLHGLFGSLENWRSMARKFSVEFTVYSIDQRNHGKSPHSSKMDYELMAEDVLELMRHEGLIRADLLGHSMGGKTAMQLALQHPNSVDRLVIADIAPKRYPAHHQDIIDALVSVDWSGIESRKDLDAALVSAIPDAAVRQFLVKDARQHGSSFRWQMNPHAIADNYDRLIDAPSARGAFAGPALFLSGDQSDYVSMQDTGIIQSLFPNARIETISKAGHWLHVEAPEAFFRIVRDFLLAGKTAGEAAG